MSDRPIIKIAPVDVPSDMNIEERLVSLNDQVAALEAGTAPTTLSANNRPNIPPPQVTQPLTATGSGVQFTFQQVSVNKPLVIDGYHIYRSADNFGDATPIAYVKQSPSSPSITIGDTIPAGSVFFYWVTAVDTTGTESSPAAAQAVAVTSGSVVDTGGNVTVGGTTAVDSSGNLKLKNIHNAVASTSSPTHASATPAVIPEMTLTLTTKGNPVLIAFNGCFKLNVGGSPGGLLQLQIARDGVLLSNQIQTHQGNLGCEIPIALTWIDTGVPAGLHTWDVRWDTDGSAIATAVSIFRSLQVLELG